MSDRERMRISDEDRHRVAEVLREAAGDGRIDLGELDERLEATYGAKTYADLVPITVDLPAALAKPATATPVGPGSGAARQKLLAVFGGVERKGAWEVPQELSIACVFGGAELELREATFAAREVSIAVTAVFGGASIIVGPDVHVVVEGIGILGGFSSPSGLVEGAPGPDAPRLRVSGVAVFGGVSVERKHKKS
ncbi:hypothetical protein BH11ACT8_BH11ACT8_03320 [soil metagenome]